MQGNQNHPQGMYMQGGVNPQQQQMQQQMQMQQQQQQQQMQQQQMLQQQHMHQMQQQQMQQQGQNQYGQQMYGQQQVYVRQMPGLQHNMQGQLNEPQQVQMPAQPPQGQFLPQQQQQVPQQPVQQPQQAPQPQQTPQSQPTPQAQQSSFKQQTPYNFFVPHVGVKRENKYKMPITERFNRLLPPIIPLDSLDKTSSMSPVQLCNLGREITNELSIRFMNVLSGFRISYDRRFQMADIEAMLIYIKYLFKKLLEIRVRIDQAVGTRKTLTTADFFNYVTDQAPPPHADSQAKIAERKLLLKNRQSIIEKQNQLKKLEWLSTVMDPRDQQ